MPRRSKGGSRWPNHGGSHWPVLDNAAVFDDDAVDLACQHAKGIPRALNNVLAYALVRAAWQDVRRVDRRIVTETINAQTQG